MDALTLLTKCPLFAGVSAAVLAKFALKAERIHLNGGDSLFSAGAAADSLYIVITGALRAVFSNGQVAGDIACFEAIGEIGLLTGEPRSAGVHALRACQLYKFNRADVYAFGISEPSAMMLITKGIINRLREPARYATLRSTRKTRTFAVLAADESVNASHFAMQLAGALSGSSLITYERAAKDLMLSTTSDPWPDVQLSEWFGQLEFDAKQLVYDVSGPDIWTRTALRQADRVLVIANAKNTTLPNKVAELLLRVGLRTAVELVVLREQGANALNVLEYKRVLFAKNHYFVRSDHSEDIASLARQLTGYGVGLVLGGGGARGFAHVGLLKAMKELNIPVDLCGGASMGAFVAALHASGRNISEITTALKETFVDHNYLNDYTIPRLSLIAGKKIRKQLHNVLGELRIEQMDTPFFCVSTNLTRSSTEVHTQGIVADWLAASMCIPILAPPVAYNGCLLVDGAVINSLPTDVMESYGRGPIVACDVSLEGAIAAPDVHGADPDFDAVFRPTADGARVNLLDVVFRTTSLTSEASTKSRTDRSDLYLRMPVGTIKTFDWPLIDAIIEKGYRHAMNQLPMLFSKLANGQSHPN